MGNTVINENEAAGFSVTPTGITIGGKVKEYATYAAMLAETNPPKYASVVDASADPSVGSGSAFYKYSNGTWVKIHESESNDITWDTLEGKPNISSEEFVTLVNSSHTHANIGILNKFSADPETGNLLYNGSEIGGNEASITTINGRLTTVENTVDSMSDAVDAQGIAISGLQSTVVKSVNNVTPDANGNVTINVDVTDGTVKSVNGIGPDSNGDVSIPVGDVTANSAAFISLSATVASNTDSITAVQGIAANNLASISALDSRVEVVEGKAHEHNTTTNFVFSNELFGCTEKVEAYKTFSEFALSDEVTFDFMTSAETGWIFIGNDKLYWTNSASGKYDGILDDLTGGLTNLTWAASSNNVLATIAGGSLYVRAHDAALNAIPAAGNLLGNVTALSNESWTIVPDGKTWKQISCHIENWLAIDNNGNLYGAGKNYYGLQFNDEKTGVVNTLTLLDASGDWIDIGTGRYHNMGMRGTIDENGVKHGTIYAWGQTWTGAIGNGISYRQDMKTAYGWTNGSATVYTFATAPAAAATVYTFDTKMTILGRLEAAAANGSIVFDGVSYTRDSSKDIDPSTLYVKTLTPVEVAIRDTEGNITDTVVYDDWFKMEAGYYHNAALRKNPTTGKTEVYLWGDNEYGQFGNGNYVNGTLTQSTLTEDNAALVELWSYATLIEDPRFDDAVDVRCAHYGTFIRCASGKIYFAGCNKRNYLGTGTFSEETAFIPYFTELSTMFRNNIPLVSTYGAMVVRNSPRLADDADPVVAATYTYPLSPKNIDAAVTASHNHSIDTATIDAAAILVSQFASVIPTAAIHAHSHYNLADLNAIAVRNGVLYINNNPYGGSSSGGNGGTGVTVDPTNVQLDSLTDVAGLSNLAGGFGFEVLSYRKVSDNEAYIHVAPVGDVINCQGRYVDLMSAAGTEIISAEEQSKGLYAVCTNSSTNNGYVFCTKDLVTKMEAVAKSSSAYLRLYYVDTAHASSPSSGTLALQLTGATISGYGNMQWKPSLGSVVAPDSKFDVDMLQSVGIGSYSNEEKDFQTIYTRDGVELVTEETFKANKYYLEDGTEITNIGMISIPTGQDENEEPTYSGIYSDASATTVIVSSDVVKNGIFIKDGTMMVQVKPYMIPEKFDETTFANGAIYIHPGSSNFSGMANQSYTFDSTFYIRETTAVDGEYPIKSAILRLHSAVTDGDPSNTNYTPMAGSLNNPMYAAIYSPNRYSTSSVNGEYNSAVGFNSSAAGNQVTVMGDFSSASGLCNVVSGDMSQVDGLYNIVQGSNSNVHGEFNLVGGAGNYVFGNGNVICGQYTYAIGDGNMTLGVRGMAIGRRNLIANADSVAIGSSNTMNKGSKYSISIGSNLTVDAQGATVVGQLANIAKFEGNFPGDNLDTLYNITADQYTAGGYDDKWISNKDGMFFCAGTKENQVITTVVAHAFTKYICRPNNAFFGAATGSSNRTMDPYIYEPFFQHTFTGVINQTFTDAKAKENDATKFTFTTRNGGRVKSFDPGLIIDSATTTVDLDFNKAIRWKLKDTTIVNTLIPKNFVDGAEAYVIIYGGVTVSWSAFAYGGNVDESIDANHFDGIVWVGDSEPRAVDSLPYGFQMVKLMVVDNTVVAQLIADTCTDVSPTAIAEATASAEGSAAAAAGDEAAVAAMTAEATELDSQVE